MSHEKHLECLGGIAEAEAEAEAKTEEAREAEPGPDMAGRLVAAVAEARPAGLRAERAEARGRCKRKRMKGGGGEACHETVECDEPHVDRVGL